MWLKGVFEALDLSLCLRQHLWHSAHGDPPIDMLALHKTLLPHRVFLNLGMSAFGVVVAWWRRG